MAGQEQGAVNRRGFVGLLGLVGAGAIGTALAPEHLTRAAVTADDPHAGHDMSAQQTTTTTTTNQEPTADEMDAMHEAGVKSFPAPTEGLGGQPLPFTMDGDVKVFE